MRSLDFTVCTTKCTVPCWRKLTKEEEEWLKNNLNRTSYADFDCANKTVEEFNEWLKQFQLICRRAMKTLKIESLAKL